LSCFRTPWISQRQAATRYDAHDTRETPLALPSQTWTTCGTVESIVTADIRLITLSSKLNVGEGCGSVADWRGAGRTTM
jgi:hypothetical protein